MKKREVTIKAERSLGELGRELFGKFGEWIKEKGYKRRVIDKLRYFLRKPKDKEDVQEAAFYLLGLENPMDTDDLINAMIEDRFGPLATERFLIFGEQYPEIWVESPVITLDTVWERDNELYVPGYWEKSERFPDMLWLNEVWGENCLIAASPIEC